MPDVTLEDLCKTYPSGGVALRDFNLHIGDGELLAVVGPSGCGKTTLLRLIAGLQQPSSGTIRIGGRVMNNVPPSERDIGLMFQRPALYPHRTVRDNLGFSLELQGGSGIWRRLSTLGKRNSHVRGERVTGIAQLLGLSDVLDRYPSQLSGGQQQRVALGRVLVRQTGLVLLDEPLNNLDARLRDELRRELHLLQRQLRATMLFVTHDPVEALGLGDRVAVLESGRLRQVERPETLLRWPANRFVAGFLGWPQMNFLDGEIKTSEQKLVFATEIGHLPVPAGQVEGWKSMAGRDLTLGFRPESVQLEKDPAAAVIAMQVRLVEHTGRGVLVTLARQCVEIMGFFGEGCPIPFQLDTMAAGSKVMIQVKLRTRAFLTVPAARR